MFGAEPNTNAFFINNKKIYAPLLCGRKVPYPMINLGEMVAPKLTFMARKTFQSFFLLLFQADTFLNYKIQLDLSF